MALKKRKKEPPGVPEWIVTFGDLMSLLLTFFILVLMFSELKQDREYQRVLTGVKEAFGYSGGVGVLPIDDPPLRSIVERLEATALKAYKQEKNSQSTTDGVVGPEMKVKTVREGLMFSIGGPWWMPYSGCRGTIMLRPVRVLEITRSLNVQLRMAPSPS